LYPDSLLSSITEAEGDLLEAQGDVAAAARVYRRLLAYVPASPVIKTRLERLCGQNRGLCDFRTN
ncbi:MAG: hypothetical protein D6706_12090, partial [Chloroflexi bacterium]